MWYVSEMMANGAPSEAYAKVVFFENKKDALEYIKELKEYHLGVGIEINEEEGDMFNESEEGFYIYKDDDLYKVSVELGKTDKVENGFEIYMD